MLLNHTGGNASSTHLYPIKTKNAFLLHVQMYANKCELEIIQLLDYNFFNWVRAMGKRSLFPGFLGTGTHEGQFAFSNWVE